MCTVNRIRLEYIHTRENGKHQTKRTTTRKEEKQDELMARKYRRGPTNIMYRD